MHYKNGREAKVGDWAVGPTHNSGNEPRVGRVLELMPLQGPCNVKLHIWRDRHYTEEGAPVHVPAHKTEGETDFADAKELVLCADGYRMLSAIEGHGKWDGPYL